MTTQPQAPYETLEEAVAIARDLAPRLHERVAKAEELRRLPDENVAELLDSGLIGLEVPRRFSGAELNLDALLEVTAALAESCSATGWVYALWGAHMWLIGQYPQQVQAMVFGDPRSLVSSVVNTTGTPVRVDGGYRWTGRGFFSSGVDHCTWLTAAVNVAPDAPPPGDIRWLLLRRSDFEIDDDWYTLGLKGTGSKTIVLDDVFVPDERIVSFSDLSAGRAWGPRLYDSDVYKAAFEFTFTLPLAGPVVGIARAVLKGFEARMTQRLGAGDAWLAASQSGTLSRMALCGAEIEAAMSLLLETARRFCTIPLTVASPLDKAQCRRDVAYSAQLCRQAANALYEAAGGSNAYEKSEIGRLWRDSNVAAAHASLQWDSAALGYGRTLVGLSPFPRRSAVRSAPEPSQDT
ncbi:MAG TPA: oxidoreductase [Dehalococcoidia bacterium]|nr:oxidoreductase [Dehalococcoidia bacterium]